MTSLRSLDHAPYYSGHLGRRSVPRARRGRASAPLAARISGPEEGLAGLSLRDWVKAIGIAVPLAVLILGLLAAAVLS